MESSLGSRKTLFVGLVARVGCPSVTIGNHGRRASERQGMRLLESERSTMLGSAPSVSTVFRRIRRGAEIVENGSSSPRADGIEAFSTSFGRCGEFSDIQELAGATMATATRRAGSAQSTFPSPQHLWACQTASKISARSRQTKSKRTAGSSDPSNNYWSTSDDRSFRSPDVAYRP